METEKLLLFIKRKLSEQERREVLRWLASDASHRERLFELEQVYGLKVQERFADKERVDYAFGRLESRLGLTRKTGHAKKFFRLYSGWAAASFLAFAMIIGSLFYLKEESLAYHTVIVPTGEHATLLLCDGTKISLNAGSRLEYPTSFNGEQRCVKLKGEAYFEVAKDKKHPFVVDLQDIDIKVLGTKFNVRAYKGENCWVNLAEGSVEVSTEDGRRHVTMKPDDQVCYTTDHRLLVESGVDASASLAWMSGGLKLHGLTLREIANILERKYSVEIHVSPDLAGELFNCHFDSTITLQEALKLLSESGRFKYREKGNEIYFYNQ